MISTGRKTVGFFIACIALCVMASLIACSRASAAVALTSNEVAELNLINQYRQQHGLGALALDARLQKSSQWMSGDLAAYGYFSHTDHLGRDPFTRIAAYGYPSNTWRGENLAAGNDAPQATFDQWRNSPEHNANMLDSHYTAVGVAEVADPSSPYGYYWTTDFGSSVTQPLVPASSQPTTTPAAPSNSGNVGSFSSAGGGGPTTVVMSVKQKQPAAKKKAKAASHKSKKSGGHRKQSAKHKARPKFPLRDLNSRQRKIVITANHCVRMTTTSKYYKVLRCKAHIRSARGITRRVTRHIRRLRRVARIHRLRRERHNRRRA